LTIECILAAMDGMTHAAFRSICFEYGAHGASTEMIPAISYARARKKRMPTFESLLARRPEEMGFLAAQIIGAVPEDMSAAARRIEELGRFDAIEINMGCPARKVVGSGNGSALLNDPERAGGILRAVCQSVQLPVRLKMRLGWDEAHITAPEIARIAEEAGCSAIILHGRTRSQMYTGQVMLEPMRRVRDSVSIPVYANGAVQDAASAIEFAKAFDCEKICIGRAALKMPWIFDDIRCLQEGRPVPLRHAEERVGILMRFAQRLCLLKPEEFAVCEIRKFCRWYLSGLTGADECTRKLYGAQTLADFLSVLDAYLDSLICANDACFHPELQETHTLDTVRWFTAG